MMNRRKYFILSSFIIILGIIGLKSLYVSAHPPQLFHWKKSGSNIILTNSGDNVGIGTTAPTSALHILRDVSPLLILDRAGTGTASSTIYLIDQAGTTRQIISYNAGLSFRSDSGSTDHILIDNSGNVGIGTTSPDALLHAEKSTALTSTQQEVIRISATTTGTPAAGFGDGIGFELETDANSAGHMEVVGGVYGVIEDATLDSEDGAVIIKTMTAGAAATEKMRINSSGGMVLQGSFNYGVDAEATDAYVIDLDPNLSAYTDGLIVYWDANNPNDGACTLRLTGGLAAKALKTQGHDDPPANYIEEDSRPGAMFNAGADYWILITPDANP